VALQILYWAVTLQLRAGLERRRDVRLVRNSDLFDPHFYVAQCPGDAGAQKDPVVHYLLVGAPRGLDPSPLFDGSDYADRHPEAAGKNPLAHFIRSGGAGAKARTAPGTRRSAAEVGESLLAGHPLRASPEPGSALVVRPRVPGTPGDEDALAAAEALREKGYPVTFVSADVERGLADALGRIASEGSAYRFVFLSDPEQAFGLLPAIRAHAPGATVIYEAGPGERNELLGRMDRVNAICSDVVLVGTAEQRASLLGEAGDVRVELIPAAREQKGAALRSCLDRVLGDGSGQGGNAA
jgi:hypothetical protein